MKYLELGGEKMEMNKFLRNEPYKMYIDGEFVSSISGEVYDVINPANNEVFSRYYVGSREEVTKAVDSAKRAFDSGVWSDLSPLERANYLIKAGEIFKKRMDEFSVIETLECGKLYSSVKYYEAQMAYDAFKYFSAKARHLRGEQVPCDSDHINVVFWEPHGVVAEILPWNGPMMMGCQKISAILAAGNTVVVKPSSVATLSMLILAEVFDEAGFPRGVFNVVTGSGSIVGNELVNNENVDLVSMTGGTDVGVEILENSSSHIKDVALELGGKSPNIVFEDVEIDRAVSWARFAFTLNSGQVCVSGTRLFVQRSIYEKFLEKLKDEVAKFVPGDGFDESGKVNFNTLISKEHADKVRGYIKSGIEDGARLICGGETYENEVLRKGNFVPPTIFADVTNKMRIYNEEIFGPVLCVTPFDSEDEVIKMANETKYGLAGSVFTENLARGLRVAKKIKSGQIYVNTYFSKAMIESPGTGWKQSGLGIAGIKKYMRSKTVFVNINGKDMPQVTL